MDRLETAIVVAVQSFTAATGRPRMLWSLYFPCTGARQLPRSLKGQAAASGLGPPHGRQLGEGLDDPAHRSQRSSPEGAYPVVVEPGALVPEAVDICPCRVLAEMEWACGMLTHCSRWIGARPRSAGTGSRI